VLVRNDPFTALGLDASGDIFTLSVQPCATRAARREFSPAGHPDTSGPRAFGG